MMDKKQSSHIKRAQKESLLLKELSTLLLQVTQDDSRLRGIFINRVQLSQDKGICTVYFYTAQGAEFFKELMPVLILYKPSMRKALSMRIPGRYTPQLVFKFDTQYEKQERIENLFEKLKDEQQL